MLRLVPMQNSVVRFFEPPLKQQLQYCAYVSQRWQIDCNYPIKARNVVMMARIVHIGWFYKPSRESKAIVAAG